MRKTTNITRQIALHPDQKRHILSKHRGSILPTGCSIVNSLSLSREWGQLQEKVDPQMRRYPRSAGADCRSPVSASRNLLWGQSLQTIRGAALETHMALECMSLFVSSAQLRKGSHSTEKTSKPLNVLHLRFQYQEPVPREWLHNTEKGPQSSEWVGMRLGVGMACVCACPRVCVFGHVRGLKTV